MHKISKESIGRLIFCGVVSYSSLSCILLYRQVTLSPETVSDILEVSIHRTAIEALVCCGRFQRPKVTDVRSYLDVVEVLFVDDMWHPQASTVPCHMELWMVLVDVLSQLVDGFRIGVATHETHAGNA